MAQGDIEQPISDGPQGAGVAVAFGSQGVVFWLDWRCRIEWRCAPNDRWRLPSADYGRSGALPCSSYRFVV
jgi:hypothetical protein